MADEHHDQRPYLLWIALAILIVQSLLLGMAITALREPRVSFPLLPKPTAKP